MRAALLFLVLLASCSEKAADPQAPAMSESESVARAVADVEAARAEAAIPPPAP
ncbi:MAG: hypothetical protein SNJ79_00780 [Sphingomonadaceae bacterium]